MRHLAKFRSDIWQIHPFGEGNTRVTAVFMIKYMKAFGFNVNNEAFEHQSDKLEFIKDPVVAEFLGLASNTDFTESDFEKSILTNLQKFLMELGKG